MSDEYVRVGTWLLPEGYGADYDHFTGTIIDTKPGICMALYAKVEDLRGTRYEYLIGEPQGWIGKMGALAPPEDNDGEPHG